MAASSIQQRERSAGLLLIASAVLALLAANSPLAHGYHALLEARLGPLTVHQWISDGLMAVFFLLVGLEVKRECIRGELADPAERRLPLIAAAGGMAVPAAIYLAVAGEQPRGWAIPAATDIAFAIGVLALLGPRASPAIKLLLVTIAVVDDVGAIAIIALFYAGDLNLEALASAVLILALMLLLAARGERRLWPFLVAAVGLWLAVLASGVHATIAGVAAALTIPISGRGDDSPLERLEHRLQPWVMFGIMPLFGFANAGAELAGGFAALLQPTALGVLLGLFVGKQIGVLGSIWLAERSGLAARPAGTQWLHLYGMALLCGIGFTMSLFIGGLAFPGDPAAVEGARLGTLAGSLLSALAGLAVLRFAPSGVHLPEDEEDARQIFAGARD